MSDLSSTGATLESILSPARVLSSAGAIPAQNYGNCRSNYTWGRCQRRSKCPMGRFRLCSSLTQATPQNQFWTSQNISQHTVRPGRWNGWAVPVWPPPFIFQTAVEQVLRRFQIGCSPTVDLSIFYLHSSAFSLDTGNTRLTKGHGVQVAQRIETNIRT